MSVRSTTVKLRAEVTDFKRQFDSATHSVDKATAAIDKNGQKIQTASARMVRSAEVNRESWQTAGTAITAFGVAGAAALTLSAKAAIEWESAWAGVLKTVNGAPEQLDALEQSLRQMPLELPASSTTIAGVAEAAGQLGVGIDGIESFTRTMINLGETTNLSADEAATALARMSNIFGTAVGDVDRMGATIVDLGNKSATTEAEIVAMATRLAAAGKQAGLSEANVLAFASTLTSVGVEAEAGGTALSKVFTSIGDATRDGGDKLATFAKVAGVSVQEFQDAFEKDAAGAIAMFIEGMGRLAESGESTTKVFDDLELTDERLKRSILSAGSAGELLNEQLAIGNDAWKENTALTDEAAKRYETTAAQLQLAKNAINEAAITIGEDFLPVLADMAGAVANISGLISGLPDPVRKIGTDFTVAATGVALLAGGFLILLPRIIATRDAMNALNISAGKLGKGGAALAAVSILTVGIDSMYQAMAHAGDGWKAMSAEIAAGALSGTRGDIDDAVNGLRELSAEIESTRTASESWWKSTPFIDRIKNLGVDQGLVDNYEQQIELNEKLVNSLQNAQQVAKDGDWAKNFAERGKNIKPTVDQLQDLAELNGIDLTAAPNTNEAKAATEQLLALASANNYNAQQAEIATQATEAEAEALQKWMEAAAAADGSFINIQGAYDSIIEKNRTLAQSTADATKSTEDSWEDFYDGQAVSAKEYIQTLQDQVDAQSEWEENMTSIAERVRDDLTEDAAGAAQQMIDELLSLGPQGAAQVALLADLSDEEFAKVVDLYGQRGEEATAEFAESIHNLETPAIDVTVNTDPAESEYYNFIQNLPTTVTVDILPQFGGNQELSGQSRANLFTRNQTSNRPGGPGASGGGYAGGGTITGPGTGTSDSIPIWASNNEYMQTSAAHNFWGTRTMDAMNNMDVSALWRELGAHGFRDGGAIGQSIPAPQVVTFPVTQRHETLAPIHVTAYGSDIPAIEAEAERRRANSGGLFHG
jgi:TP901 family phage tail tape measure protein